MLLASQQPWSPLRPVLSPVLQHRRVLAPASHVHLDTSTQAEFRPMPENNLAQLEHPFQCSGHPEPSCELPRYELRATSYPLR